MISFSEDRAAPRYLIEIEGDKALKAIEKRVKDMAESVTAKSASSVTVQDLAALDRVPRCPFTNRRSAAKEKES